MSKFNVVLHGLIALHDKGQNIVALLPSLPGIHVQRAGDWLVERDLQPRADYELTGVKTGSAQFDSGRNMILGKHNLNSRPPIEVHAQIKFPRPKEIYSLRVVTIDPAKDFSGASAPLINSTRLATLQIFVYECDDVSQVLLQNHTWTPPGDASLPFANLHVFSEEEFVTSDHALEAFHNTAGLFEGVDLKLNGSQAVPQFDPHQDQPPFGVSTAELENLALRQAKVAQTGRLLLLRPLNLFEQMFGIWGDFVPAGGSVRTCSFPIAMGGI